MQNSVCSSFVVALSLFLWPQEQHQELPLLPSLNTWELTSELLMSHEYQAALDVDPGQLQQIREIRGNTQKYTPLLSKELSQVRREFGRVRTMNECISIAWRNLESTVRADFSEVLEKEQLAALVDWPMRIRFPTGSHPFRDRELLDAIEIDVDKRAKIQAAAQAKQLTLVEEQKKLRLAAAREVIKKLPPKALERFSHLVGDGLVPGFSEPRGAESKVPFPPYCSSTSAYSLLCSTPELRDKLNITNNQRRKLDALQSECSREGNIVPANTSFVQHFHAIQNKYSALMAEVLSENQLLKLKQGIAARHFLSDFEDTFNDQGVSKYLDLDRDAMRQVRAECVTQEKTITSELAKRNRRIFNELVALISSKRAREVLSETFREFWR